MEQHVLRRALGVQASLDVTTDQHGEPRPGGTMCDVGAFEVQP